MPKLSQMWSGRKAKNKKVDLLTPEQKELQALIQQGLTKGEGPFADIYGEFNQEEFDKGVVNPAMKNFQENILPMIQEKFISGNAALGSGMQRAQVKGASDLQSQLAQLMYQAQQQQKQGRQQGVQQTMSTREFENMYQPRTVGMGEGMLQGFTEGASKAAGKYVGSGGNPVAAISALAGGT